MSEKVGGVGTVAGQADVLTHVTTHHQSFWCTVRSIALLSPDRGHLQSREGRLFLRLDALERAQHNGIMEQTAPEGAHSPLTCASILLPLGGGGINILLASSHPLARSTNPMCDEFFCVTINSS